MMKDKFFHKEFNPAGTNLDEHKVKIMSSLGKEQLEGDILEHLVRTSKNEILSFSNGGLFEKLEPIT
jgi:hypothetical protein